MKSLKRGLFLVAFALILITGVTQANAATKYKNIESTKGGKVTVSGECDLDIEVTTKTLTVNAPKAKEIGIYDYDKVCTSLDLSKCTSAKSIRIYASKLSSIKVPKNGGKIKEFRISTGLKKLSLPTMKNVTYFSVYESDNLTSVNTKNLPNLKKFVLQNTPKVSKVDLSKNSKLETIAFSDTALKSIDTSKNSKLKLYSVGYNTKLTSVDVTKNTKLTALQCYNNKISTLKVGKKNTKLKEVDCEDNKLTKLDLTKTKNLKSVNCENNKLKKLDLSKAKNIKTVTCYGNPLKTLKVGSTKNILKTVSKTAQFDSVAIKNNYLTVKMKKTGTIKDYILLVENGTDPLEMTKKSGLKYVEYGYEDGENPKLWAISGVKYKKSTIYFYKTEYKYN